MVALKVKRSNMNNKTNDGDTLRHFNDVRDVRVKQIQTVEAPKKGEITSVQGKTTTIKIKPAVKKMGGSNKAC